MNSEAKKKVRNFYKEVEVESTFDYGVVAAKFEDHDVFANPPQWHSVSLPYLGEVELTLIAVAGRKIAVDDGGYHYKSRVSFFAKPTPSLMAAGFEAKLPHAGDFAGIVDLTGNQGCHQNLFGHPLERMSKAGWVNKTPSEFCTTNLPNIVQYHRDKFYPKELHRFPFEYGTPVVVFAKDSTKIGGYTRRTTSDKAMDVFHSLYEMIYINANGNVNVTGHIIDEKAGIGWKIPPFGKDHVFFVK